MKSISRRRRKKKKELYLRFWTESFLGTTITEISPKNRGRRRRFQDKPTPRYSVDFEDTKQMFLYIQSSFTFYT